MANKRFMDMAKRMRRDSLPTPREKQPEPTPSANAGENTTYPDMPSETFIFSYDGPQKDYFQELIAKSNERFRGTKAEIPIGTEGEVTNMYILKRMALVSTIANSHLLKSANLLPITPAQSEHLLKEGKLQKPDKYWEDLGLILYDTNSGGRNPKESAILYGDIANNRADLGLSYSDLEERLVIVNAGIEKNANFQYGVKPIILPGITQVYQHEVLEKVGQDPNFDGYGLNGGLPLLNQLGSGSRTLYMPDETFDIGLRVLIRDRDLYLVARGGNLTNSIEVGRVNFAPQGRSPSR